MRRPIAGRLPSYCFAGIREGVVSLVDARYAKGIRRYRVSAVSGAASGIEDSRCLCNIGRRSVSREMFVPQVDIDVPGHDALACKLDAHAKEALES